VQLSFLNASFVTRNPEFIGFKNYIKAFQSAIFWKVVRNSLIWTIVVV
jgi:ABC-type sugar transport system permease subunit